MSRSFFFFIFCLVMCSLSSVGGSEKGRKDDRKLLALLKYKWNGPKKYSGREEVLARVRKLRGLLKGEKGKRGARGEKGVLGKRGRGGACGKKGRQGPIGKHGPKGEKGDVGHIGNIGPKGDCGATGEAGPVGKWETREGEISIKFRPKPGTGNGFWQAIVISPSGKTYVSRVEGTSAEGVAMTISPVEIGVYALCWKNGVESSKAIRLLKEIEVDSSSFNGDHVFYKRLLTSKYGEQKMLSHVVVKEIFK